MRNILSGAALSLLASNAFAQTGPVAEAPDQSGVMPVVAVVVIIGVAGLVLALFEPWNWLKRKRKRRD